MCVQLCMRTAVLLLLQLYVPCTLGLYVQSYAACTGAMPCMRSHACMHRMHRAPPPPPPPPPPRIAARARSRRRRRESQRALAARPPAPRAAAAAGAMHPRRRPSRRAARLDVRCVHAWGVVRRAPSWRAGRCSCISAQAPASQQQRLFTWAQSSYLSPGQSCAIWKAASP
jgi:hypothetical protein